MIFLHETHEIIGGKTGAFETRLSRPLGAFDRGGRTRAAPLVLDPHARHRAQLPGGQHHRRARLGDVGRDHDVHARQPGVAALERHLLGACAARW